MNLLIIRKKVTKLWDAARKKENLPITIAVILTFVLFYTNAWHEKYPDEFDNIMGGWLILKGNLIYRDWFTHHGPVPYFLASFIEIFSQQSFVRFRVIYELLLASFALFGYWYVARNLGRERTIFYPFLLVFLGLIATYYWFHMLLADSVSAFLILPCYLLVFLKTFYNKSFSISNLWFISVLVSLTIYSSLAYSYFIGILVIFVLIQYYRSTGFKIKSARTYLPFLIFLAPHIVYGAYLLLTGSLSSYVSQAIQFNTKYYIYNYPRPEGVTTINPIRYAIIIAHIFYTNFFILILGAFKFEFSFPLNITLAVGSLSTIIYLALRKKVSLVILVTLLLIYSNVRSNPLDSRETDYQSAVYIIISLANIFFVIPSLFGSINSQTTRLAKKALYSFLLIIVTVHSLFSLLYVVRKYEDKMYLKYMGEAPLIYDRPEIAPILNDVLVPDDYVWIGPFEFEEIFYTNQKLASRYQILIPGMGHSPEIQEELINDLEKTKPKIIVFDKTFFILGQNVGDYGRFLSDFLDQNYVNVLDYREGNTSYSSNFGLSETSRLDIDANFYLRRDMAKEIIQKLLEKNYIRVSSGVAQAHES